VCIHHNIYISKKQYRTSFFGTNIPKYSLSLATALSMSHVTHHPSEHYIPLAAIMSTSYISAVQSSQAHCISYRQPSSTSYLLYGHLEHIPSHTNLKCTSHNVYLTALPKYCSISHHNLLRMTYLTYIPGRPKHTHIIYPSALPSSLNLT